MEKRVSNIVSNNQNLTPVNVYESFNTIMFSSDKRVFNKMIKKIEFYGEVKDLVGDILEFGVFMGSGMAIFLKLQELYEPNSISTVIGFDHFNKSNTINQLDGNNRDLMSCVLNRVNEDELSLESVRKNLSAFDPTKYMLVQGEAVEKCRNFHMENPGLRIKILYMDLDLGEPTYQILKILWNKVVKGGIVVFDEYGYHKWDEANGVDKFLKEIDGQYELFNTKVYNPTVYIKKTIIS